MGAYKDRQRGTWYANFTYTDHDGQKKAKLKRGFATKRDAQAFEEEFLSKYIDGTEIKLKDFISEIYLPHIKQIVKLSSFNQYVSVIKNHIIESLGEYKLNELNDRVVIEWQNNLLKQNTPYGELLEPTTLHEINCKLSSILNYADKCYSLKNNPISTVKAIGTCRGTTEMKFWTVEQYKKVRELLKEDYVHYCAIEILFWAGLRRGELMALTKSDIDFENRTITVDKTFKKKKYEVYITSPKTKSSYRKVSIPKFLADELKDYLKEHDELTDKSRIFNFTSYSLTTSFQKYSLLADVPTIRIHDLRHSHVSMLIDCGYSAFEIAKRVGHEAVDITYRYAHLHPRVETNLVKTLEDLATEHDSDNNDAD